MLNGFYHFPIHKSSVLCIVFNGAKSLLDLGIVEAADQNNILLYYLPLSAVHELQPFEYLWDQEVQLYWLNNGRRIVTKNVLGKFSAKCGINAGHLPTSNQVSKPVVIFHLIPALSQRILLPLAWQLICQHMKIQIIGKNNTFCLSFFVKKGKTYN